MQKKRGAVPPDGSPDFLLIKLLRNGVKNGPDGLFTAIARRNHALRQQGTAAPAATQPGTQILDKGPQIGAGFGFAAHKEQRKLRVLPYGKEQGRRRFGAQRLAHGAQMLDIAAV